MLRNPKKTLQAINNCVTVALPLTSVDLDRIIESVKEAVQVGNISGMEDIDLTTYGVEDGSLLVYNKETEKWQSTRKLERQVINAGEY